MILLARRKLTNTFSSVANSWEMMREGERLTLERYPRFELVYHVDEDKFELYDDGKPCKIRWSDGSLVYYLLKSDGYLSFEDAFEKLRNHPRIRIRQNTVKASYIRAIANSVNKATLACHGKKTLDLVKAKGLFLRSFEGPREDSLYLGKLRYDRNENKLYEVSGDEYRLLALTHTSLRFFVFIAEALLNTPKRFFSDKELQEFSRRDAKVSGLVWNLVTNINKHLSPLGIEVTARSLGSMGFMFHITGFNDEVKDPIKVPTGKLSLKVFDLMLEYQGNKVQIPEKYFRYWYYLIPVEQRFFFDRFDFESLVQNIPRRAFALDAPRKLSQKLKAEVLILLHDWPGKEEIVPANFDILNEAEQMQSAIQFFSSPDRCPLVFENPAFPEYSIAIPELEIESQNLKLNQLLLLLIQNRGKWIKVADPLVDQLVIDFVSKLESKVSNVKNRKRKNKLHRIFGYKNGWAVFNG